MLLARHTQHANAAAMTCLVIFSISLSSCNASQGPKYALDGPLNQDVSNYEAWGNDFEATADDLMQKYRVPAGMDLETLPDRRPISVKIPRGNVADVLNAIVAQQPGFKWAEMNGVINIGPRKNTKSILNVRIAHFHVTQASFEQIHFAIFSLPEVKRWLADNHLAEGDAPFVIIGGVSPGQPFKPLVSLDLQNMSLREILNTIIKSAGYRTWVVSRYGENNQYLMIGIN